MAHSVVRWLAAALFAVGCAALGVYVASVVMPSTVEPAASPTPVIVAVTATATAFPSPPAATLAPVDGINLSEHSIDKPDSVWVVVNKRRALDPLEFEPKDLVGTGVPGGGELTKEAAAALRKMYEAAAADGAPFRVSTAYRSYNFQKGLFQDYVRSDGVVAAERYSARPGYSEHQTGLSLDVLDPAEGCHLKRCFATTDAGKWLYKHAADYGFIERYPDGGTDVTGYKWEPWHWRYVGVELAQYMREEGIATLEEAFDLPAAPSYK